MDVIELSKRLIKVPSTIGRTSEIEEFVRARLEQVKACETTMVDVGSLGRNVVGRVDISDELPTIIVNGHLDTVEVCKGWTREPFEPVIEGDRLYGLGSADMKAGVALGIHLFHSLANSGKCNVTFIGTIDEEGNSAGAFEMMRAGITGHLCLIPEPSSGTSMMGCRGRVVFEIDVRGASAHGSRPEQGVNAITEAGLFVGGLSKVKLLEDESLGKGSFCPLEINGGTSTLSVPDSCWIKLDRHHVRGEDTNTMLSQLKGIPENEGCRGYFNICLWKERPTPFLEPYLTENAGLAKMFNDAVGAKFAYGKSVGDYNVFAKMMQTVVYGPHGENWHAPDEWVSISSIKECLEGYGRFIACLQR